MAPERLECPRVVRDGRGHIAPRKRYPERWVRTRIYAGRIRLSGCSVRIGASAAGDTLGAERGTADGRSRLDSRPAPQPDAESAGDLSSGALDPAPHRHRPPGEKPGTDQE